MRDFVTFVLMNVKHSVKHIKNQRTSQNTQQTKEKNQEQSDRQATPLNYSVKVSPFICTGDGGVDQRTLCDGEDVQKLN